MLIKEIFKYVTALFRYHIAIRKLLRSNLYYKSHFSRQWNWWSLRCSWRIACRRCFNYIFIGDLTPGFDGLGKDNCKTRQETFKFWDLVRLIVRRAGLLLSQQDFEWRWSVPLFKCLTVLEFSFILFDLCLLITFFNFIMNYVPIVTFWIFTYHKIWILSIMFCFIWSYWIIYFLACLEVSWRVVS